MKRTRIAALLACLMVLCLALAGCGGGGKKAEEAKAAFVGSWTIYSIESNDGTRSVSNEDIALLQAMGQNVTLTFNEDDTVKLDIFGNAMDGTWKAKNTTEGTVEMGESKVDITIAEDGKLSFSDGKDKLIFTKGAAATAPAATAPKTSDDEKSDSQDASAEGTATDETAADATADDTTDSETADGTEADTDTEAAADATQEAA